jgi:DNA invertase Pin-like site-specific DNA recombinase
MPDLWTLWDRYFKRRPDNPNRNYLQSRVAYKLQEQAFGGLPAETQRRLINIGMRHSKIKSRQIARDIELAPGTVLLREWSDRDHKATQIASPKPRKRCAVYCRVSSDERLDQEFNSIDAQKEAGQSYVASQRAEGWIPVADDYDDPGFSGGNTERPGLKRLMADIERGQIDIVVVYKIDRLTRSLADFSKMVEVFERHGVSFVSVTQQFNTTTSMGRLMLNVLLSFAQFEREVTGERIRDKIAASKRKGLWMGGVPPLGYDVENRLLVINDTEAAVVRRIFGRC